MMGCKYHDESKIMRTFVFLICLHKQKTTRNKSSFYLAPIFFDTLVPAVHKFVNFMVMEDAKVPRVKEFKYLGSTVQESGGCEREVKKRVQAGWNGWRRVSGVICDRRLPARVKGKVYSSMVRPAMVYGLETVAVTKKQVEEMEVAEMKMLRFAMGVTRKDKIRNENIRSTVKVEQLGMKMREGRMRWYGHVMRRD